MELSNLESQIKQKLESSTIQPSSAAWGKLDLMLDEDQNTKRKKNFSWIYIAASIFGFLLIGTVFSYLTETKSIEQGNGVVIHHKENEKRGLEEKVIEEGELMNTASIPDEKAVVVSEKRLDKTIKKERVVTNNSNNKTERSIINQVNTPHWQNNKNKSVLIAEKSTPTVEEIIAQVAASSDVVMKSNKVTVDASYLLSQVDTELELSFREKVISKVSKNYQTVKLAFANRNLE
ncbi:hypothetical protein [Flavobacterium frigoris]|uniref:Uncharacterized protein n=1 Tax=Flavobacterium frigoris TaxID=229204 RepID=A0A1H9FNS0_FLAFI|nr:hypothetical protein [Flavobacterium frigoris]SEQ39534.1 hypothetical protein SAMN05444355_102246 [Flavobacterium frigoris]